MTDCDLLLTRGNLLGLVRQVADPDKEDPLHNDLITLTLDELERLASLVAERVAAVEREACAQVCDEKSAKVLSMQMGNDPHDLPLHSVIAVGFGGATVTRDGEPIYDEQLVSEDQFWTCADAEKAAADDPDHDWRISYYAPLYEAIYQRQDEGHWVLVQKGMGFA